MSQTPSTFGENQRLESELADAQAQIRDLWQTLRTVAPEYAVTEADMEEAMNAPVPLENALVDLERLQSSDHCN